MISPATTIREFQGEYRYLSNFWRSPIIVDGDVYDTVEHAYQALKTTDPETRKEIKNARTPGEAKRKAREWRLPPRDDKLAVMERLVHLKFQIPELRRKLLATGDSLLLEGNRWHDNFWGQCFCVKCRGKRGENHLGRILMRLRKNLGKER